MLGGVGGWAGRVREACHLPVSLLSLALQSLGSAIASENLTPQIPEASSPVVLRGQDDFLPKGTLGSLPAAPPSPLEPVSLSLSSLCPLIS